MFEVSSHASQRALSTYIIGTDKDYIMQVVSTSAEEEKEDVHIFIMYVTL